MKVGIRPHRRTVAVHEILETLRQVLFRWNGGVSHQQRNNGNPSRQGRLDLDPHVVARAIEPALPIIAHHRYPCVADDDEDYATAGNDTVQMPTEIDAKGDRVHILEDTVRTEAIDEPIIDPPGDIELSDRL